MAFRFRHWIPITLTILAWPTLAWAHCDTLHGPVAAAGKKALETGEAGYVLAWVKPEQEAELRRVFSEALAVRALGPVAKNLAERHFFETVLRLHRIGVNECFTGLSDAAAEPFIALVDSAVASGQVEPLADALAERMRKTLTERVNAVRTKENYDVGDANAGRAYVSAYADLLRTVETLYDPAALRARYMPHAHDAPHGHQPSAAASGEKQNRYKNFGFGRPRQGMNPDSGPQGAAPEAPAPSWNAPPPPDMPARR